MATVTIGGKELTLAPLKSLQVAELMDNIRDNLSPSNAIVIGRALRAVAQSLANAGTPQGSTIDEAISNLDASIPYSALDPAFGAVLDLTGLRKPTEGEALAAESTTSESSAAS